MQGVIQKKSAELDLSYYEMPGFQDKLHRAQQEAPYRPAEIVDIVTSLIRSGISARYCRAAAVYPAVVYGSAFNSFRSSCRAGAFVGFCQNVFLAHAEDFGGTACLLSELAFNGKAEHYENRILGLDSLFQSRAKEWRDRLRGELLSLTGRRSIYEFLAVSFQSLITIGLIGYFFLHKHSG